MEEIAPQIQKIAKRVPGRPFVKGHPRSSNGRPRLTPEQREKNEIIKKSKAEVIKYLESQGFGAAKRIIEISRKAKNENVKLNANQDVLDRIGITKKSPNIGVAVQVNIDKLREQYE